MFLNLIFHLSFFCYLIFKSNFLNDKIFYFFLIFIFILNNFSFIEQDKTKKVFYNEIINKKIDFKNKNFNNCTEEKKHEFIYSNFYNRKNGISYATHYLLLDKYPCKTYFRYDFDISDKDSEIENKNFNLNVIKINNERLIIKPKSDSYNNILRISYHDGWELLNSKKSVYENIKLKNLNGYIFIKDKLNRNEEYILHFTDPRNERIMKIILVIGFLLFVYLLYLFFAQKKLEYD